MDVLGLAGGSVVDAPIMAGAALPPKARTEATVVLARVRSNQVTLVVTPA